MSIHSPAITITTATMYGSYGSYSSMSAVSAPIDIASGSHRANQDSCAFPSWPRRSSLSESDSDREPRATSYLSDDDLFLSDPFDDDARSISSASSSSSISPPQGPQVDFLDLERQKLALEREFVRQTMLEKERRRQQAARKNRRGCNVPTRKGSNKSKLSSMTTISEACE